jgi:acyl-CoA synthetase (AMP-forming)/AMP-acid ligase II
MGIRRAFVDDLAVSRVRGMPLADEAGIGALTIPGYLQAVCSRYAEREALVLHHRDGRIERWSYQQLWDRSVDVAKALIAVGAGKDSRVGILMTNRPEYLSALFGTALAGSVSVALSTFSTPSELEHLIGASSVSTLLFEDRVLKTDFAAMLAQLEPALERAAPGELAATKFPFLRHLVRLDGLTAVAEHGVAGDQAGCVGESWDAFISRAGSVADAVVSARAATVCPADTGGLFFSSGTTSLPKGIFHAQQAFAIQWWRWPRVMAVREPARAWTGNGFFWSGNVSMIVGVALSTGGAVVLQPLFDAAEALRLIERERITFMNGRPHQWARLQAVPGYDTMDLSSLRYVTRNELLLDHPAVNIDWQLPMAFGTTETMTINTSYDADTTAEEYAGSCGVPLPGNLLKIVDPQTHVLVPVGERGEICIKGPTLMQRYLGKTVEETFDEEGYFCTGDGGYVDAEGRLFWEGRLNDIIKTGGANVSPEEVDAAIAAIAGVKRVQTVGVPHDTLSEMVVSCIVPVEGSDLQEVAIIAHLKMLLASYKIPRRVLFFAEDEFALTGNEKVKAAEIRQLACRRLGLVGDRFVG